MTADTERLYAERLGRYVTAMRNEKPDRVPIRPFVAEFVARYAGYTCQDVTHDYARAFEAVLKAAGDFDWDAMVANMVYVWTGLTEAVGLNYYAIPGVQIPADTGFQYVEPPEEKAYMLPEEYDELIADPVRYAYEVWLPRASRDVQARGRPVSLRNNLSFVRGGMAMMQYFGAFGPQVEAMRRRCGTVSAIAGILKAPLDILADKFRGYLGLCSDLAERREKVKAACEALAPHLLWVALAGADPNRQAPIAIWMHRGCVPFVSRRDFEEIYWATLRPIIEGIWAAGHQTLFYAEGNWNAHIDAFAELPARSIVYHVDMADIFEVHRKIGQKFCISGGVPNFLLAYRPPREVTDACKRIIDGVAGDGGYILDAGAIVQNDARVENVRAMTDFVREYGVYPGVKAPCDATPAAPEKGFAPSPMPAAAGTPPGATVPWSEKVKEMPPITGDADMVRRVWESVDALPYLYIWHLLEGF